MSNYTNMQIYLRLHVLIYIGEEHVQLSDEPKWMQQLLQPYLTEIE